METMSKKRFYFNQVWQMYGKTSVEVPEDYTIEQSIEYVKAHWDDIPLAGIAEYLAESDVPDFECCEFR